MTDQKEHWKHIIVQMPAYCDEGPTCNTAAWWANYLLELGQKEKYDSLIEYLTIAQKNGCLSIIRLAAEDRVRVKVDMLRGIKRRNSRTFTRIAA